MKSTITKMAVETKTFYVLVTDGVARLVFYSEEKAKEYVKNSVGYENTSIQKVYGETQIVEVEN